MNEINLILDTLIFFRQKRGGVSAYWYEFIKRMLSDPDVDLTLLMVDGNYMNKEFLELDLAETKIIQEQGNNFQVLRNVRPRIKKTDSLTVFHSTYLRTCRRRNVCNVVTIHDFTHQFYFKGIKKWLNTLQKNRAVNAADMVVCVSENTKRDFLKFYPSFPENRISVIYNGASEEYKQLASFEVPGRFGEIRGEKYIIYVGDRFFYKNTDFLFKILEEDKGLHCVLVGGTEFSEREKRKSDSLKGSDGRNRVHRFTGVSNSDLNILYNAAFALVFPSLYEGFGIPVLEAMKAGCPVIAFNNSSIPEVLDGSGILIENNDIEGCMEALHGLDNTVYRNKIVKEQIEKAKQFSWDEAYLQLKNVYKRLVSGGGYSRVVYVATVRRWVAA